MRAAPEFPFNNYRTCYKTFHNREGRYYIILYNSQNDRTTISFARYLMSVHLGRVLKRHETVDHINGIKVDDRIENLQILSIRDNICKSQSKSWVTLKCPFCKKIFEKPKNQTHLVKKKNQYSACSRRCAGKFASIKDVKKRHEAILNNVVGEFRKNFIDD